MIYELVKEKDEAILTHLRHLESEKVERDPAAGPDSRSALTVKFHFGEGASAFFTEKELSLKIVYRPDTEDEVEKVVGTHISWVDASKDPTKKQIKKK